MNVFTQTVAAAPKGARFDRATGRIARVRPEIAAPFL